MPEHFIVETIRSFASVDRDIHALHRSVKKQRLGGMCLGLSLMLMIGEVLTLRSDIIDIQKTLDEAEKKSGEEKKAE